MLTSERLEHLRALAGIERNAIMEHEGRGGADPLSTLEWLPSVDEFVVRELCTEMLEQQGRLAEFAMARLAGHGTGPDAAEHRANADRVEFELLREIAAGCPELTVAVWQLAGRLETPAR
jgi:hypothetical protein